MSCVTVRGLRVRPEVMEHALFCQSLEPLRWIGQAGFNTGRTERPRRFALLSPFIAGQGAHALDEAGSRCEGGRSS
ncbi:hypothetical protein XAP412_320060 [Xanthomonas phaseoli pv. phaseoli]|uniref:Transposase n=1 Tax=Xanthomonas campestris pv. phaseoli TaxID=317013 RepID=A0AB38DZN8_XANCH|nr:hypothetical protein XAP6984_380057 [Xanthomonas phaseoli pv. phaseoli]SON83820.1 hypothetical protein XAP412_320060 [Xanthomonas phaseoli pv. phaseoli]SON88258.1 hypothetical protein XAP7430_360060 [Xanthomonas phaseoli pv. phaseoli]